MIQSHQQAAVAADLAVVIQMDKMADQAVVAMAPLALQREEREILHQQARHRAIAEETLLLADREAEVLEPLERLQQVLQEQQAAQAPLLL